MAGRPRTNAAAVARDFVTGFISVKMKVKDVFIVGAARTPIGIPNLNCFILKICFKNRYNFKVLSAVSCRRLKPANWAA